MAGPTPGGSLTALNLTAAGVVKSSPGSIYRVLGSTLGTGTLTFSDSNNAIAAQTITAITQATSAVITISTGGASNPFIVGNSVGFVSVAGMTQINGMYTTVSAIGGATTAWTITVPINSTTFTAYTSGGTIGGIIAANQISAIPIASLVAGVPLTYEWPCNYGIVVSGTFPSGGVYSIAYS